MNHFNAASNHRFTSILFLLLVSLGFLPSSFAATNNPGTQYILVNHRPGWGWNRGEPELLAKEEFLAVKRALPDQPGTRIRAGMGFIFSYFRAEDELLVASLRRVLELAQETDTPVYIQLDGEQWWNARPDLWNWWDPSQPGYNPENKQNVEWTSWSPDDAIKIAWRNWGKQLRVRPPPNLMSPRYRAECHKKMKLLVPVVLDWWKQLPKEKKDLFVGLKVGWESSIGVNAWVYPNAEKLMEQPPENDPTTGLDADNLPSRGVTQIGYAAVKTAGIRTNGAITEADLAEVARRHLEDLSRVASELGVPRDRLFTHGVGWKDGELLYGAAVNNYSCPGWSLYRHAADPADDIGIQTALKKSDAPYWAATEWLLLGKRETDRWQNAFEKVLSDPRCRLVCIYNWDTINDSEIVLQAIRNVVAASGNLKRTE